MVVAVRLANGDECEAFVLVALPVDRLGIEAGTSTFSFLRSGEGVVRGVGYGVGIKNIAFSEGFDDYSTARVVLEMVGSEPAVLVHTAAVEVGQGLVTLQALKVAVAFKFLNKAEQEDRSTIRQSPDQPGQHLDDLFIVGGKFRRADLFGQVDLSELAAGRPDRHTQEGGHRRVVSRKSR